MEREQAVKFMHDLLRAMASKKASDLFITVGFPPAIKLDGKMTPVASQALTAQHTAELARGIIERFKVKAAGPQAPAQSLSGGNLQKFIVGREISASPKLLIVSQPTWGVDVGAAAQIRAEILALRDAGCAVLVVSEELDELFELSDRLHVMAKGRLSPPLPRAEATVERIGEWMSGLWADTAAQAPEAQHAQA